MKVAFVQGGRLLATSSHDGTIRLWNPLSGACECTIEGRLKSVDQDGKRLSIQVLGERRWIEIHELARHDEVQTLVERRTQKGPFSLDIRGDGRLLVAGGPEGLRLWDLATQREVAELNLSGGMGLFHDARHELITVSPLGLFAWPMDESRKGLIRMGPPRILAQVLIPEHLCWASLCPQKNLVAALCDWNRIALLDLASGRTHCELTIENSFECMALSHDGQWMATSAHGESTFCIWDIDGQQVAQRLPREGGYPNVCFGPGDEVLVTSTSRGYRVWKVDGWQPLTRIPMQNGLRSPIAFSPRGSLAVVARSRFEAQLVDTTNWREVARLETADPRHISCFDFAPAGQVVVASEAHLIRLWDLQRIQESLAEHGVFWPLAEIGESSPAPAPARVAPVSVEIDYGPKWHQLKDVHSLLEQAGEAIRLGDFKRAIEMLQRILAIDENHAPACNGLAWLLATGPVEYRDPERAVALAKRCVDRVPYNASYLNTLGVAQYRNNGTEACIATLEAAVRLGSEGGTAFDFLFLAMAHAKLGQDEKARDYFQKAEAWRQKMASASADYRRQLRPYFQEAKRQLQELGDAPPVKTLHNALE